MKVSANFSALKKTKWYEYAVRFLLGGSVTVIAGLLAKYYGPVFGGLFLAFPAIFPASATLVDSRGPSSAGNCPVLRLRLCAFYVCILNRAHFTRGETEFKWRRLVIDSSRYCF